MTATVEIDAAIDAEIDTAIDPAPTTRRNVERRLRPEHYEPARVPTTVLRHTARPDTLPVGSPGKVGVLELGFERIGDRTELVSHYQKSPLQIMRPLYVDPARPDFPFVYLMSTGGGVLQADRLRMDFTCGADTAVHFTTQAATRVHSMEFDYGTQIVNLSAGPGAYVEYLPEAIIPFADSRFYQHTVITADPSATVLAAETVLAGRLARGERHEYLAFASDFELRRPNGELVALDTVRLEPRDGGVTGPAVLAGHDIMATLFVVTPLADAASVADTLHEALADAGVWYGVSVLPSDRGAWVRILGDVSPTVNEAMRLAWDAVRRLLIGAPAPDLRKN